MTKDTTVRPSTPGVRSAELAVAWRATLAWPAGDAGGGAVDDAAAP